MLDRTVLGAVLEAGRLIAPRVEVELASVRNADVPAGATREQVAASVGSVAVALKAGQ